MPHTPWHAYAPCPYPVPFFVGQAYMPQGYPIYDPAVAPQSYPQPPPPPLPHWAAPPETPSSGYDTPHASSTPGRSSASSPENTPVYARNACGAIEQCTVFIAGLPGGTMPTQTLQEELVVYLGALAPVREVKLVNDPATHCVKCVFAEFASPDDADRAARSVRSTPFNGSLLRMEPARGERTVRFSRASARDMYIHHQHMLLPRTVGSTEVFEGYDPQCAVEHHGVLFSPVAAEDIASRFGAVEHVTDGSPYHVDVVYARRPDAVAAVRHLGMLPPQTNLRVRWRRGGRVEYTPRQRYGSGHVSPPDPTWLYNAADAYANHLRSAAHAV